MKANLAGVDKLGLALEQAGAYIAQHRLSLASYLTEWRNQLDKVLAWYDERLMHYPKSVAVTWQTSFDQLGEPARRLLQRLAWLAPDPIPESLLDVPVPGAPADDDRHAALAELEAYSLVLRAADAPTFTVHRLVQTATRRGGEDATLGEALGWIDEAFVGDSADVLTWLILTPLLPHVRAIASHADQVGIVDPTARLMNDLGMLLYGMALYSQAEPLVARALTIFEMALGPEHRAVAVGLNSLAGLYLARGAYAKAEPLFAHALMICEQVVGPDHPDVALTLNNLALLYDAQGAYVKAEGLLARALTIWEKTLGPEHPHVATVLNNLAKLRYASNSYATAEPLLARALAIQEKALGPEHPDVAHTLNNLGLLYEAQGACGKAEPLFARAVTMSERTLGPEHPDVATSLDNLGSLYDSKGAHGKAEPLLARALAIREKALGPEHPDVALSLQNLARHYHAQRVYATAGPLLERALAILVSNLGAEHPKTIAGRRNYELLLNSVGNQKFGFLQRFQSAVRELLG